MPFQDKSLQRFKRGEVPCCQTSPDSKNLSKLAFICDKNGAPVVELCSCFLENAHRFAQCDLRSHWGVLRTYATLTESVSDSLVRNMCTSCLLEGLLQCMILFYSHKRYWSCGWIDALLHPCPAPLVQQHCSWYLYHILVIVVQHTKNLLAAVHMNTPSWSTTCTTWI